MSPWSSMQNPCSLRSCRALGDGLVAGAENDAIINIDKNDDRVVIVKAGITFAWCESCLLHTLIKEFIPHPSSLFLSVYISYQFQCMSFLHFARPTVTLWYAQVQGHLNRCLGVGHDEVQLTAMPPQDERQD